MAYVPLFRPSERVVVLLKRLEASLCSRKNIGQSERMGKSWKENENAYFKLDEWHPLSESSFKAAHAVVMGGKGMAGVYRSRDVVVRHGRRGIVQQPPPYFRVPWLMRQVFEWFRSATLHPVAAGILFHYEVAQIHPFLDGNGRMCRLWMAVCGNRWFPHPVWKQLEDRLNLHMHKPKYYSALFESIRKGEAEPFVVFMLEHLLIACQQEVSAQQNE